MLPEKGHQLLFLGCQFLSHGAKIDKNLQTPNFFRSIPYFFRSSSETESSPRPLSSRIPAHSYSPSPSFPVPSYPSLFWGAFLSCFFSLFPLVTLLRSPLPYAGVQVSYIHRSASLVAFLCTSLSDKGRFRPFSERLVHNITTAGTFSCTSETCTWRADGQFPIKAVKAPPAGRADGPRRRRYGGGRCRCGGVSRRNGQYRA